MSDKVETLDRRDFLCRSLAVAATSLAPIASPRTLAAAEAPRERQRAYQPIIDRLPAKPKEQPLNWRRIADAFDAYVMDPKNGILVQSKNGSFCFCSATEESPGDGGLTTFAPVVLGKALRGDDVAKLLPSLAGYFNEGAGIFLDTVGAWSVEYWYMMNINALAAGLIRRELAQDVTSVARFRRSADRLIEIAHHINYDFNEFGYDFAKKRPWASRDIREPDVVAGYAYVMLFAHEMLGDREYLSEAKAALIRYLSFEKNPWFEIPSGAMACLTAARLNAHHNDADADLRKALSFVLDPDIDCLQTGEWGGREVNGLMGGCCTEPPGTAYSMESMVVLPYVLPVLRYDPRYATDVGRYALNAAANMRWFYTDYLPPELQSKPGAAPAVPYERLSRDLKGHSPYAAGDYAGHRSVYGGAYALWFGELIRPTQDPYILQLNLTKTDFLAEAAHPTYLYYNPWPQEREVTLSLGPGTWDTYETLTHRYLHKRVEGSVRLAIPPSGSRVVVVIPSDRKRSVTKGVLAAGGVPIDYRPEG
jgi:hypothetical protein